MLQPNLQVRDRLPVDMRGDLTGVNGLLPGMTPSGSRDVPIPSS